MTLPSSVRSVIPLVMGLLVGVAGATLFLQSMPGKEGSPEERANKLEVELQRANNRLAALEGSRQQRSSRTVLEKLADPGNRKKVADGTRRIAEDIRDGRPVSPDEIFQASKPLLRDLAPLFNRMRLQEQQAAIDRLTGEYARKYQLTPQNQQLLRQWFQSKAEASAKQWDDLLNRDGTRLQDVMLASRNVRPDDGIDGFMQGILPPDQKAAFNSERTAQRAERVQAEADKNVQRLDAIVSLDDRQREQVFGIMASTSKDYDPALMLQGSLGEIPAAPGADREAATLAVLRPDQRAVYQAEMQRRRTEASRNMEAIGLTLPADWQMLDDRNFPSN